MHIEHSARTIARLHAEHDETASPSQRLVERVTFILARPRSIGCLCGLSLLCIVLNLAASAFGYRPIDPPPFAGLSGAASLVSLVLVVLILATQRREEELAQHRDQLTLGLAILAEQRMAKAIQLLEAFRGDDPLVRDRIDEEAQALANPSDPHAVLHAIRRTRTAAASTPVSQRRREDGSASGA
jgi:uncharacterized membrane protein